MPKNYMDWLHSFIADEEPIPFRGRTSQPAHAIKAPVTRGAYEKTGPFLRTIAKTFLRDPLFVKAPTVSLSTSATNAQIASQAKPASQAVVAQSYQNYKAPPINAGSDGRNGSCS